MSSPLSIEPPLARLHDNSSSSSTTNSTSHPSNPQIALPALPSSDSTPTVLDVSNGSAEIKLDHLGPMVVGVDGAVSRISNWESMADIEKRNTLRIIGKRNQARLKALTGKDGES
jgi:hypothetical protein